MKKIEFILVLFVLNCMFNSCCPIIPEPEPEPDKDQTVDPSKNTTDIAVTGFVDEYCTTSAIINGYANLSLLPLGDGNLSFGVELINGDTSEDAIQVVSTELTGNKFSAECEDLAPTTKYRYRTFVKYSGITHYGEFKDFTTKDVCSDINHVHIVKSFNKGDNILFDQETSTNGYAIYCFEMFVAKNATQCQWMTPYQYEDGGVSESFSSATYTYEVVGKNKATMKSRNYQSSTGRSWTADIEMTFDSYNTGTFTMYELATFNGKSHTITGTFIINKINTQSR